MSEIKLLPCPFCGGEVEMYVNSVDAYSNAYTFCCDNCYMYTTYQFSNEKEAIKLWNTRKPMERIIGKLEDKKWGTSEWRDKWRDEIIGECIEVVKEEGGIE